jgi:hypothetical protein
MYMVSIIDYGSLNICVAVFFGLSVYVPAKLLNFKIFIFLPRPEILLLLLNIQLTAAKGHHMVLYNFFFKLPPKPKRQFVSILG